MASNDPGEKTKRWKVIGNRDVANAEAMAMLAFALAHPLRVQILQCLVEKPGSASTTANELGVELGTASYHLNKVLHRQCEIVTPTKTVQVRGAWEHFYRVDTSRFFRQLHWPSVEAMKPAVNAASLVAFVDHASTALLSAAGDDGQGVGQSIATWRPAAVDAAGWQDLQTILAFANVQVLTVLEESAGRLERGSADGISVIYGVTAFEAGAADEGG